MLIKKESKLVSAKTQEVYEKDAMKFKVLKHLKVFNHFYKESTYCRILKHTLIFGKGLSSF